jgi:hypothetical protein
MAELPESVPMCQVLAWHPYSRSNDLLEEFGEFSKELEVVARSRGGVAAVDLFSGRGIEKGSRIAKTILQSVIFAMTDVYGLCIAQADKIEKICQVTEHDVTANMKGLEKGERIAVHFGPVPELFDSLCEYLICQILRRTLEMWMAVQYVKAAAKLCRGDVSAVVPPKKKVSFLSYVATELSEDPLIVDDDMIDWISNAANLTLTDLETTFQEFRNLKVHHISDFLWMIKWKRFFQSLYNEVLVISELIYTSYGSSTRWDDSALILPITMLSSGAVSNQRTLTTVFNGLLPENSARMRAHKRLLRKLFPS